MTLETFYGIDSNDSIEKSPKLRAEINTAIVPIWEKIKNNYPEHKTERKFIERLKDLVFFHQLILDIAGIKKVFDTSVLDSKQNILLELTEIEQKQFQKALENYELFRIVNDNDDFMYYPQNTFFNKINISGMPIIDYKSNCHSNKELKNIHRGVMRKIINQKGQILMVKRSELKSIYPGFYELGGGHCGLNSYYETLIKELKEELDIDIRGVLDIEEAYTLSVRSEKIRVFRIIVPDNIHIEFKDAEVTHNEFLDKEVIKERINATQGGIIPAHRAVLQKELGINYDSIFEIDQVIDRFKNQLINILSQINTKG